MFYYDEPYEEHCCVYCEEHDIAKSDTVEFMQGIIDQLYGNERFDADTLERCIEEAAYYFGLKIPEHDLKIKTTQMQPAPLTDTILNKWKELNNKYLKSLTH